MQTDKSCYMETLLELYLGLPETPSRGRAPPTSAWPDLYQRRITLETVEAAMLLVLPVVKEISANPLPEDYLHYLRY